MSEKRKVLCVDDEQDLLDGIRLNLRKAYRVSVATSGAEGLELFDQAEAEGARFDVVVSDMRMPGMDGAEFLTEIFKRSPQTPRILLSGQADIQSTIAAINNARIFRFLTKPCSPEVLQETLNEAMEIARLRDAERELLDRTIRGVIGMLTEVIGLVSPSAYSRTVRIREIVNGLCDELAIRTPWDLDIAAMLSQVGCVVVAEDEAVDHKREATLAAELLDRIPRLDGVAEVIRHHMDDAPPSLASVDEWTSLQVQQEILRAAVLFERVLASGASHSVAVSNMDSHALAPFVTKALSGVKTTSEAMEAAEVAASDLVSGMELTGDLMLLSGTKLAGPGTQITPVLLQRLRPFIQKAGVREPIEVLAPASALKTARMR